MLVAAITDAVCLHVAEVTDVSRLRVRATVRLTVRIIVGSSRCTTLDKVALGVDVETVLLTRDQA